MKLARVFCAAVLALCAAGVRPEEGFAAQPRSALKGRPLPLEREHAVEASEHRQPPKDESVASLAHGAAPAVVPHAALPQSEPQPSSIRPAMLRGGDSRSHASSLLQRSVRHARRRRHWRQPDLAADEGEMIMGMPKLVWVILMDVVAMSIFLSCIPTVMYLGKQRRPDFDSPPGFCDCIFFNPSAKKDRMERMGV